LIKQLVHKLRVETRIRNSYLYQEGEQAKNVYLVKEGQFLVSKKLVWTGGKDNKCEAVSTYKNEKHGT
jgi:CRP-like cAMP-binding protein